MMDYVNGILESKQVFDLYYTRHIRTDKITGSWADQNVALAWEGTRIFDGEKIILTPDVAITLLEQDLLKNNYLEEENEIKILPKYFDLMYFKGAIVCGILSPSTKKELGEEFIAYAKKKGCIKEKMTPVQMLTGTKSLIMNQEENTYSIFFEWNAEVLEKINRKLLEDFTNNYFRKHLVEILDNGILMKDLSEAQVFSEESIELLKMYDNQLLCLDETNDKQLLLIATMIAAYTDKNSNLFKKTHFVKRGNIIIPDNRQDKIEFENYGQKRLSCGTINNEYSNDYSYCYGYKLFIRTNEKIDNLLQCAEVLFNCIYGKKVSVLYKKESKYLRCGCIDEEIRYEVNRFFVVLDYAVSFFDSRDTNYNPYKYNSIISLLEADSRLEDNAKMEEYNGLEADFRLEVVFAKEADSRLGGDSKGHYEKTFCDVNIFLAKCPIQKYRIE